MTTDAKKYLWVCRKKFFISKLEDSVKKREVVNVTPKGVRLRMDSEWIMFHSAERYVFFETELAAMEHIASEANRIAGELEESKRKATLLLCDAHNRIRDLKAK